MNKRLKFAVPALAAVLVAIFAGTYGSGVPEQESNQARPGAKLAMMGANPGLASVASSQSVSKGASVGLRQEIEAMRAPPPSPSMDGIGREKAMRMARPSPSPMDVMGYYAPVPQNPRFSNAAEQSVKQVVQEPVSTFSLDVDTASYTYVRKLLTRGQLPSPEGVRVEEMINYFPYKYAAPENKEEPFAATVAIYPCPWNKDSKLMHVGLKAYKVPNAARPKGNFVFLVDVSGSMSPADRLPMLKNALAGFVDSLRDEDHISIVTYAGQAAIALEPTPVREKDKIKQSLAALSAGGNTAGGEGLRMAYDLAERSFDKQGNNHVILASDGDFNVGTSNPDELQRFIEAKREKGIYLTVLGVGEDNLNDNLMQRLAQFGNGTAAYLDGLTEARRVLGEQVEGALVPVANDAKVQIEFNPARVAEYRLIGYETRGLRREDFNNDKIDAGDVGSGQSVTAIYEITPPDSKAKQVDALRYEQPRKKVEDSAIKGDSKEYAFLKIRYKLPGTSSSKLMTIPISAENEQGDIKSLSPDLRFAASVAGFGQLLRNSSMIRNYGYNDVIKLAETSLGDDAGGLRHEFVTLVSAAKTAAELNTMPQGNPGFVDPGIKSGL